MKPDHTQIDLLKDLFSHMAEEELPVSFRTNVMQQIRKEAVRMQNRRKRLEWVALIGAVSILVAFAGLVLVYAEVPKIEISMPRFSDMSFYIYIGALTLVLLGADYKLRQLFKKKQADHKDG